MSRLGPLQSNGRVVILGGGPAGTAAALMLHRLASDLNRPIQITLLEGKQFSGELHYNQCVGVLSSPLPELLEQELRLPYPHHLSRAEISGYVLHTTRETLKLDDPCPSVALRRVQFDAFMLDAARERGIEIMRARAIDVEFHDSHVVVYTENAPVEAEVLIGAFGLDEGSASMLARATRYRPPHALNSVVTKFHPGIQRMESFGTYIHAFLPTHPKVEFGGITPKGNHLTVNIAGSAVDSLLMERFLSHPLVSGLLKLPNSGASLQPDDGRLYRGRFPSDLAHGFYGDRYVVAGDAAGLVRPFKGKGVTSAILSGIRAAECILTEGLSEEAFRRDYRAANVDVIGDLGYGKMARFLTNIFSRHGFLDAVLRAAHSDASLRAALLGAVSGHTTYKEVLFRALSPRSAFRIVRSIPGAKLFPARWP